MKKYSLYIALSSCFLYIRAVENHASYVLEIAQKQFGTTMSFEKYNELKESIIDGHEIIKESSYPNIADKGKNYLKFHCNSKSGNTLLVYSAYKKKHGIDGFADIVRLKENFYEFSQLNELKSNDKPFKEFAFPVIASLKVWSKNSGLKIPKPIIDTILQYGYPCKNFDYDGPRKIVSHTLYEKFNECGYDFYDFDYCSLFVNDQKKFVINFEDKDKNNIIYAQTKGLYPQNKENNAQLLLIVPSINRLKSFLVELPKVCKYGQLEIDDEDFNQAFLIEKPEVCEPGQIEIDSIDNNILTVTKDDKKFYTIDYSLGSSDKKSLFPSDYDQNQEKIYQLTMNNSYKLRHF